MDWLGKPDGKILFFLSSHLSQSKKHKFEIHNNLCIAWYDHFTWSTVFLSPEFTAFTAIVISSQAFFLQLLVTMFENFDLRTTLK